MKRSLRYLSPLLGLALLVAGCGDGGMGPAGMDDFDVEDLKLGGPQLAVQAPVPVCHTVTFDDYVPALVHGSIVATIPVPFGTDLSLTLTAPPAYSPRIFYGLHPVGPPDNDLRDTSVGGDCIGCGTQQNMLVVGATADATWGTEGDRDGVATMALSGFPATGTTYVETYVTVDQEVDQGESGISFWVGGAQFGASVDAGNGVIQTVTPSPHPNLGEAASVEFRWDGSGALDDIKICHVRPPPDNPGTGTIGYWMNHPGAWPILEIEIGGTTYPRSAAIAAMKAPGKGDKTYEMFAQLVAAKLNVEIGNDDSCIAATIAAADAWMTAHPLGSGVKAKDAAWKAWGEDGDGLKTTLDDYNNGDMCAPHRDD